MLICVSAKNAEGHSGAYIGLTVELDSSAQGLSQLLGRAQADPDALRREAAFLCLRFESFEEKLELLLTDTVAFIDHLRQKVALPHLCFARNLVEAQHYLDCAVFAVEFYRVLVQVVEDLLVQVPVATDPARDLICLNNLGLDVSRLTQELKRREVHGDHLAETFLALRSKLAPELVHAELGEGHLA